MASALIQGRNGKPGITPDTVWNICGTLLSVFKFAKLWGYPVCEFKRKGPAMPDYNPPEVKPFTVEEALRIFAVSGRSTVFCLPRKPRLRSDPEKSSASSLMILILRGARCLSSATRT